MPKLNNIAKYRRRARRGAGRRFYTGVDMAMVKHDAAVQNSQANRGDLQRSGTQYIAECGCGFEGCFIHGSDKPRPINS